MRISDTQFNNVMLNGMAEGNKKITTLLEQLYSGERITKISDDPVASIKLLGLDKTLNESAQYMRNIDNVTNEYQRYESTFMSITSNLQDINELILLAKNDPTNADSYVIELESLKENLVASFNAKDISGAYLFSGTNTNEAPFIRDDDTGEWVINPNINSDTNSAVIGEGQKMDINFPLGDVDAENILALMNNTIAELKKEDPDLDAIGDAHDQLVTSLDSVLSTHAKLGSRINNMLRLQDAHADTELFAEKMKGDLKNLNYDEAVVMLESYLMALQASQSTFAKLTSLSLINQI